MTRRPTSTTTPTTSRSTPIRIRCSAGCARRRRSTTTSSTTSTRVSRYDDVERGLVDRETLHLRARRHPRADQGRHRDAARRPHLRGPADAHHPPGPALAGVHAEADERARAEDPRVLRRRASTRSSAPDRFDFVADLGAQMPMRVIGMLLGIPEQDQEAVRDHADASLRTEAGRADGSARRPTSSAARCSPSTSTGAPSTRPTTS